MVQRDRAPPSERFSLNRPPAFRLVLGESTGLFGLGLERSSRDQARRHFALATSCFQEEHCKTEQGIGLLTISVGQQAANLDLPNLRCGVTASPLDKPFIVTGERAPPTRTSSSGLKAIGGMELSSTVPVLRLNPRHRALWAEPVLLQRMTSSRQGKPEKESSIQRKSN